MDIISSSRKFIIHGTIFMVFVIWQVQTTIAYNFGIEHCTSIFCRNNVLWFRNFCDILFKIQNFSLMKLYLKRYFVKGRFLFTNLNRLRNSMANIKQSKPNLTSEYFMAKYNSCNIWCPCLLTWFNLNPNMNKWSRALWSVWWNYASITKLQLCNRWSWEWLNNFISPFSRYAITYP